MAKARGRTLEYPGSMTPRILVDMTPLVKITMLVELMLNIHIA